MKKDSTKEMIKKVLLDKINELSRSIDVVDTAVDSDGDETDESQANFILSMLQERKNRVYNKITMFKSAIDKVDTDEYGICEECGEQIDIKRLTIFPEAIHCICCAEQLEKESKEYRR